MPNAYVDVYNVSCGSFLWGLLTFYCISCIVSQLVESALAKTAGGDRIVKEYNRTKSLTDSSR